MDPVNVVVVGDVGSGKTALVWRIVRDQGGDTEVATPGRANDERLPERLPLCLPRYTVELADVEGNQEIQVLDTTAGVGASDHVLVSAHVVIVCVSRESKANIGRLTSHWLPLLAQSCTNRTLPVVVATTKLDLPDAMCECGLDEWRHEMEQEMEKLQTQYDNVLWLHPFETSAAQNDNATFALQTAVDAVIFPLPPLMDPLTKRLRPACSKALQHVFKLLDQNSNGFLDFDDMKQFQVQVFGVDLVEEAYENMLEEIEEGIGNKGATEHGITMEGFEFVHHALLLDGDASAVWTTLRHFGYTDSLVYLPKAESIESPRSSEPSTPRMGRVPSLGRTAGLPRQGSVGRSPRASPRGDDQPSRAQAQAQPGRAQASQAQAQPGLAQAGQAQAGQAQGAGSVPVRSKQAATPAVVQKATSAQAPDDGVQPASNDNGRKTPRLSAGKVLVAVGVVCGAVLVYALRTRGSSDGSSGGSSEATQHQSTPAAGP